MATCLLAIDAGTGSGRAVLFDDTGRQLAVAQEEWTHIAEADAPGSMSFDCEANWALIGRCIRRVLAEAGLTADAVKAVSSTSMREGIVLYDEAGREVWACANVDGRAGAQVKALKAQGEDVERGYYRESGQTFALGALPRLLWVKERRPAIFEKVRRLSMINDWVAARLSGEIAVEPSNGGTSGLLSLSERVWSDDLIARSGIDRTWFPPVVEPGTVIGPVTAAAAESTGLRPGTPVVAGGGDAQLGTVGLGVVRPGGTAILGGTFWQQVINVPIGQVDETMRVRINPHAVAGLNQAECISFFVGLTMRWFRDVFCETEKRQAEADGIDAYELMERQAARVPPGSHGVLPVFSDAMDFGRWYHAAPSFLNLSIDPTRCSKATLFRALEENAAIVSAINLERVAAFSGVASDGPIVFAGGASKGRLWAQILADVTGRPLQIPVVREATALGCAAAAAVGAGLFASLEEAGSAFARFERTVEPDPSNAEVYADLRSRWSEAYAVQKDLVDRGITTSLWKAPGL
ncbi:MAG: autoinducer-2 kinase [Rhodospirillales bacterium]|nr:autoinducer-2 kinase [Rhodospirillales bacterium]